MTHPMRPRTIKAFQALRTRYGPSDRAIAKGIGAERTTVRNWRESLGIAPYERCAAANLIANVAIFRELQSKYRTDAGIGSAVGINAETVRRIRCKLKIPPKSKRQRRRREPVKPIVDPVVPVSAEKEPSVYQGAGGPPIAFAREPLYSKLGEEAIAVLYDNRKYEDDPRPVRDRRL